MVNEPQELNIVVTAQCHNVANIEDNQIESVSNSLSASANYLRKLVEGESKTTEKGISPSQSVVPESLTDSMETREKSTIAVKAIASYRDVLIGLTEFDKGNVDTPNYVIKKSTYESVLNKYPKKFEGMLRDEKVKALSELKAVGFKYYSIKVTVFLKKDGLTERIFSKAHHRLEKVGLDYLEHIATDTFKATLVDAEDVKKKILTSPISGADGAGIT